jgi:DNA adenine methylase
VRVVDEPYPGHFDFKKTAGAIPMTAFAQGACRRPLLRYHGGKWKLADWIIAQMPEHRLYVEPFAGAASVLLRKPRSQVELINDRCSDITNLFAVVRDNGAALKQALMLTPFARDEFLQAYEPADTSLERARRMVVRACLGRASSSSSRNTKASFRAYTGTKRLSTVRDWLNYPRALDQIIERLQGVIIENRDAMAVFSANDHADALFYVDPPYLKGTRDASGGDYRFEMSDDEHVALAHRLQTLKGSVLLSGYQSELYHDLYGAWGWEMLSRQTFADGAQPRIEVLWVKR